MIAQAKAWIAGRRAHLSVVVVAVAASMAVSVLCDTTPDVGHGDFSLVACLMLGPFVWPIAFATAVPLPFPAAPVLMLSYWPLVAVVGYLFVAKRGWLWAVPAILLIVVPAFSAAFVFEGMMGV